MNGDRREQRTGLIENPYLDNLSEDYLIHLEFNSNDLPSLFGDVKFVCMGGTSRRMEEFAKLIMKEIKPFHSTVQRSIDFTKSGERFSIFKVGNVLCVNHGIGYGSITIVLHEIIKLLHYAGVSDPIIFRIGTSGGIGTPSGTVIIANEVFNDFLEEYFEVPILGKKVKFLATMDRNLAGNIKDISDEKNFNFPVLLGKTMSNEHFYESVASVKASFCDRNDNDRKIFFDLLKEKKILNADMEAVAVAALTNKLGIKSAIVNVVVNDILHPNENVSVETKMEWQTRPQKVVAEYIKRYSKNI